MLSILCIQEKKVGTFLWNIFQIEKLLSEKPETQHDKADSYEVRTVESGCTFCRNNLFPVGFMNI